MLNELQRIEFIGDTASNIAKIETLCDVDVSDTRLPVYALTVGSADKYAPIFGITGGVHGLERIGCHVVISWLESLIARLQWDQHLNALLSKVRLLAIPLVNPGGLLAQTRSNPNGVDLMRNAPIDGEAKVSFLVGGQRLSSRLPWYRGLVDRMEPEAEALVNFFNTSSDKARSMVTIDCHSGFGLQDRLWYPYAKRVGGFPGERLIKNQIRLFSKAHPNHPYIIEPQANQYTTHGDLWDYLYDLRSTPSRSPCPYTPWTLEMGSWSWIRKNPRQLFSAMGVFNPTIPHRYKRTMRRHLFLLDTLLRIAAHPASWIDNT